MCVILSVIHTNSSSTCVCSFFRFATCFMSEVQLHQSSLVDSPSTKIFRSHWLRILISFLFKSEIVSPLLYRQHAHTKPPSAAAVLTLFTLFYVRHYTQTHRLLLLMSSAVYVWGIRSRHWSRLPFQRRTRQQEIILISCVLTAENGLLLVMPELNTKEQEGGFNVEIGVASFFAYCTLRIAAKRMT